MGTHSLPIVLGRRSGVQWDRRLGQHCTLQAVHDERHVLLECSAMQTVRHHNAALFSPATGSMQLFMWQPVIVGVAHFVMDCFELLAAAPADHDDYYSDVQFDLDSSSLALADG